MASRIGGGSARSHRPSVELGSGAGLRREFTQGDGYTIRDEYRDFTTLAMTIPARIRSGVPNPVDGYRSPQQARCILLRYVERRQIHSGTQRHPREEADLACLPPVTAEFANPKKMNNVKLGLRNSTTTRPQRTGRSAMRSFYVDPDAQSAAPPNPPAATRPCGFSATPMVYKQWPPINILDTQMAGCAMSINGFH